MNEHEAEENGETNENDDGGGWIDKKVLDVRRSSWPYQAGVGVREAEVKVNTRYSGRIFILQVHLRFEILPSQPPSLPLTKYVWHGREPNPFSFPSQSSRASLTVVVLGHTHWVEKHVER